MSERWPWGAAGVRLTDEDRGKRALERARRERQRTADEERARAQWAAGLMQPWALTLLLDAGGHFGPTVDEQLGVHEPTVDEWEAGTRYPTWEQVLAISRLCNVTPLFLTTPRPLPPAVRICSIDDAGETRTSIVTDGTADQHVLAYEPAAVAHTVGTAHPTVTHLRTPGRHAQARTEPAASTP